MALGIIFCFFLSLSPRKKQKGMASFVISVILLFFFLVTVSKWSPRSDSAVKVPIHVCNQRKIEPNLIMCRPNVWAILYYCTFQELGEQTCEKPYSYLFCNDRSDKKRTKVLEVEPRMRQKWERPCVTSNIWGQMRGCGIRHRTHLTDVDCWRVKRPSWWEGWTTHTQKKIYMYTLQALALNSRFFQHAGVQCSTHSTLCNFCF